MPELMLINPAKRRVSRKARPAKRHSGKRKARRNPISVASVKRAVRRTRRNPIRSGRRIRRRRNPISMRSLSSGNIMKMLQTAALGGAGAVAMDVVMAQVNKYLPASLQPSATGTGVGLNDAVRLALTIVLGRGASRMTKGASEKMAVGALAVQMADIGRVYAAHLIPSAVSGVGYSTAARTIPGTARVSPLQMGMYGARGAASPLLSAYGRPGAPSPLLARAGSARAREGSVR